MRIKCSVASLAVIFNSIIFLQVFMLSCPLCVNCTVGELGVVFVVQDVVVLGR